MAGHTPIPPAREEASDLIRTPSSPYSPPPTPASPNYTIFALNGAPTSLPDSSTELASPIVGDGSRLNSDTSNLLTRFFKSLLKCINARKAVGETGLAWHEYTRTSIDFEPDLPGHIPTAVELFKALVALLEFYTMSWLGGRTDGYDLNRGQYLLTTYYREELDKHGVRHGDVADFVDRLCRKQWPKQEAEKTPRRSERLKDRTEPSH